MARDAVVGMVLAMPAFVAGVLGSSGQVDATSDLAATQSTMSVDVAGVRAPPIEPPYVDSGPLLALPIAGGLGTMGHLARRPAGRCARPRR